MAVQDVEEKDIEQSFDLRNTSDASIDIKAASNDRFDADPSPSSVVKPEDESKVPEPATIEVKGPRALPRFARRGWLAKLSVVAEVEEPKDYARGTKWFITFIVAVAAAAAPIGSGIVLPALTDIAKAFNSTAFVTNLSVSFYMLSMAIFPLFWSSFSEILGRRTIYLSSFLVYFVFNVLSAESQNIAMFLVMRILSGGASASVQAVGAGTIADIWEVKERGRAMGIFYLGPLCGPLIAPIVGGALAQGLGWRSTMWFQVIYGVVIWFLVLFFLPETLKVRKAIAVEAQQQVTADEEMHTLSRTTTRQSVKLKTKKYAAMFRTCFIDPLAIILNLRSPPVALVVYYASATFGSLYVLNVSVQQTFEASPYNYSTIIVGLLYVPNSLGYIVSSILGGKWVDYIMHREARKAGRHDSEGGLILQPEDRMRENAWLGALMYPAALLWYGWSAQAGVLWICPMIANFFFGVGTMLVFGIVTTMLTEFMPDRASHGIALNNFIRNIFACVGSLVAEPIIKAIGNGWLFTILGCWTLISGPLVIWSIMKFGDRWRESARKRAGAG
ncbi:hypothetical protein AAFC00_000802 [Neodothiora populina]|uniref:Major facilitator superfamily (MFS) profile domain-containing protein n=1 Tax=Neodothiora populina TaxID=2781224 RepID=A0ABR3PLR8_9PEZI